MLIVGSKKMWPDIATLAIFFLNNMMHKRDFSIVGYKYEGSLFCKIELNQWNLNWNLKWIDGQNDYILKDDMTTISSKYFLV